MQHPKKNFIGRGKNLIRIFSGDDCSTIRMTVELWYVELMRTEYERKPDIVLCHSFESACIVGKFMLKELKLYKFSIYDVDYENDERLQYQEVARENTKLVLEDDLDSIMICCFKNKKERLLLCKKINL